MKKVMKYDITHPYPSAYMLMLTALGRARSSLATGQDAGQDAGQEEAAYSF